LSPQLGILLLEVLQVRRDRLGGRTLGDSISSCPQFCTSS
jgi:hypothetical protein